MTAYIKLLTGEYPRHEGDIRLEHPEIGEMFECPSTYAPVTMSDTPPYSLKNQVLYEGLPEQRDGVWYTTWLIRSKTAKELEEDAKFDAPKPDMNISGSTPDVIG